MCFTLQSAAVASPLVPLSSFFLSEGSEASWPPSLWELHGCLDTGANCFLSNPQSLVAVSWSHGLDVYDIRGISQDLCWRCTQMGEGESWGKSGESILDYWISIIIILFDGLSSTCNVFPPETYFIVLQTTLCEITGCVSKCMRWAI